MVNFVQRHRRPILAAVIAAAAVIAVVVVPGVVHAGGNGPGDIIAGWIADLGYMLIRFFANLLVVIINIMVAIAGYNDFLGAEAVTKGWAIVRDVSNMFFIVALLVIAFGTILRLENYRYNKFLARIIVMAVLVNFSKMIAGLFIDFGQVIMLTFVNAWRDAAAGNITHALGLSDIITISNNIPASMQDQGSLLTAVLLGDFLMVVACVVMAIVAIVLILRILALWFLVVLSPLAYTLRSFSATEKYAQRWWQEFGRYVTVGPVMAFLLWLALSIMQSGNTAIDQVFLSTTPKPSTAEISGVNVGSDSQSAGAISAAITDIGRSDRLLSYMMGIMLLVGTLMITREIGVAGGQLAGQAAERIKGFATKAAVGVGAGVAFGGAGLFAATAGKKTLEGVKQIPGFAGRRLDEALVRGQQGQGWMKFVQKGIPKGMREYLQKHPVSLRPSEIKKAYGEYRQRREAGIYTVAHGGMVDLFNNMMSRFNPQGLRGRGISRTDFANQALKADVKKKKGEAAAAGTRKERVVSDTKGFMSFDRDANGKIIGGKINSGNEAEVEARMQILTEHHDINEIFKDQDIRELIATTYADEDKWKANDANDPDNVVRLLKMLFGAERGADVGQELGQIGLENNDIWLYGLTDVDEKGRARFIDSEAAVQARTNGTKTYGGATPSSTDLQRYDSAAHGGKSYAEYEKEVRDRENAAVRPQMQAVDASLRAGRITKQESVEQKLAIAQQSNKKAEDELGQNRDFYDRSTQRARAEWVSAYNAKRTQRVNATNSRRQDYTTEVGIGNAKMYFRRKLHTAGQYNLRDILAQLTDYKYATGETKEMYQRRLDLFKALADIGHEDKTISDNARKRFRELNGGEDANADLNEQQRLGIYNFIGMALGKKATAATMKPEDLDRDIEQYMGGQGAEIKDTQGNVIGHKTKYGEWEDRFNDLLEENREKVFDNRAISDEVKDSIWSELERQAADEVGVDPANIKKLGAPVFGGTATGGSPLADVSAERFDATQQQVEDYEARMGEGSFFQSQEFLKNRSQYLDQEQYNLAKMLEEQEAAQIGGIAAFSGGASNTLAIDASTFAGGKFAKQAGHYLRDPEAMKQFASEYVGLLDQEYGQLEQKVDRTAGDDLRMKHLQTARARLQAAIEDPSKLKDLKIVNTARSGYSARHVVAHEDTHAKLNDIDPDRTLRTAIWSSMGPEQQQQIVAAMRLKTGDDGMGEDEAFEEYLTEGLVNAWDSWADRSEDAVRLDPKIIERIQQHAAAAGQKGFMVSAKDPELEELGKTPSLLGNQLAARGYSLAGKSRDVTQFAGKKAGNAALGMQLLASTVGRKLVSPVVGVAQGAQRALETRQIRQLSRKRMRAVKLEETAKMKLEVLNQKKVARMQQEETSRRKKEGYHKEDAALDAEYKLFDTRRVQMVRSGKTTEAGAAVRHMEDIQRQRTNIRQRADMDDRYVDAAKFEEIQAETEAKRAVQEADQVRTESRTGDVKTGVRAYDTARQRSVAVGQQIEQLMGKMLTAEGGTFLQLKQEIERLMQVQKTVESDLKAAEGSLNAMYEASEAVRIPAPSRVTPTPVAPPLAVPPPYVAPPGKPTSPPVPPPPLATPPLVVPPPAVAPVEPPTVVVRPEPAVPTTERVIEEHIAAPTPKGEERPRERAAEGAERRPRQGIGRGAQYVFNAVRDLEGTMTELMEAQTATLHQVLAATGVKIDQALQKIGERNSSLASSLRDRYAAQDAEGAKGEFDPTNKQAQLVERLQELIKVMRGQGGEGTETVTRHTRPEDFRPQSPQQGGKP